MALAKFTILLYIFLYKQGVRGQQSSLLGSSSVGQNSLNQVLQSNLGTTQESAIQNLNGNAANKAANINAQVPVNFQSLSPQSTVSAQSTLSLQHPLRTSQATNLQLSQIPNFQQDFTAQPSLQFDASLLQQPSQQPGSLQQLQNLQQSQNVYRIPLMQQMPCTNQLNSQQSVSVGDFNIQQTPIVSPVVKQIPVQSSQGISAASLISSTPSVSAITSYPYQRTDYANYLGANYYPSAASGYSYIETPQTSTPYATVPVMAVLATPSPIPLVTHSVMPYSNPAPDIIESPLRISNNFFIEDETNELNQDNLTSLVLSLLQSPKKSSKSANTCNYLENPYLSSYLNQGSKTSSIRSLLPLILNILSDRSEGCGCQNCEQSTKNKDEDDSRILNGYSKKRDNSLREEMFQKPGSKEDNPRMVREQKKANKLKNITPVYSCEDDDADYSDCSDEDED